MSDSYFIHPKALVDEGVKIGKGTRVWAFAQLVKGAEVGEGCNIGAFSFIEGGAKLGNQVTVKNGVQIWEGVVAEDGVFFGPNCVLTNHLFPRAFIKQPKEHWLKKTLIKRGSTLGANSTIVCGTTVGSYAMVSAGAVVTKDVPDFALVKGVPARHHSWICRCTTLLTFSASNRICCLNCSLEYQINLEKDRINCLSSKAAGDFAL